MKKITNLVRVGSAVIAIFAGNALFAEDSSALNPNTANDWKVLYSRYALTPAKGEDALVCRGGAYLFSKDSITIEKDKIYKLSGSFKLAPDSKPSKFYFGIMPLDDKNLQIPVQSVNTVAGTETELTSDCAADDTAIKIKNGEKWEASVNGYIAFNVDDSGKKTDLPNRELSSMGITKLKKDGDVFKVTLKDKCGKAYPAGRSKITGDNI